jgi:hypothetical protein
MASADPPQVIQGGELDQHLALALTELDSHRVSRTIGEPLGQLRHPRSLRDCSHPEPSTLSRSKERLPVPDALSELLRHTDREPLGHDPVGEAFLLHRIVQRCDRVGCAQADNVLAAIRRWTLPGRLSRRIALAITGRLRPRREASSCCVIPKSAKSCL